MGAVLRYRTTRHESEYPASRTWIDEDSVRDDLPPAIAAVDAAERALTRIA
ncbi:hypothetical protein ACIBI9_11610 [Nonomuraea sp. NPDC050451]|uniref:hypothetical protein n=1 Tax=Nonomuraea sp. NPDC050451 TaxID=3364364 RepID=UPI00378B1956